MSKIPTATMNGILVGTGILNWPKSERVCDRYGFVMLLNSDGKSIPIGYGLEGQRGTLRAVVTETRDSYHVGDAFRGLIPSRPDVGDVMELGTGTVVYSREFMAIGLKPDDGREDDWLDPKVLYRLHHQTVNLFFEASQEQP